MADAIDSDSPPDGSSSDRDRDWYARHWNRLCDELDASDPTEVLARVQAMKREINRASSTEQFPENESLVTISEVEEVFREMNQKMEKLRERNTVLVERLEQEGTEMDAPVRDFHQKAEQLLDSLDAATMDEARERIQKLNQRLEALYQEKEQLAQAEFADAEAALDAIDRLREERDALRRERDRLQDECRQLEQQLEATDEPAPSAQHIATAVRDQLGLTTPGQVDAFAGLAEQLHERVRARAAAHNAAVDDAPENVVETLHSVAAHLGALPDPETPTDDEASLPPEVGDILGIRTVEEARELDALIADLSNRLERLGPQHEKLADAGLTVDMALDMIENMEAQLAGIYHGPGPEREESRSASPPGPAALDASLRHRVAAHTETDLEAIETLPEIVRLLVDRLDRLAAEHDRLTEAGLGAGEAVAMVESMEAQLDALYHSSENTGDPAERLAAIEDVLGISTRKEAEELSTIAQQMEEQLTTLYQDKQKLQELGLATIGDAIDMIENMEDQLDDLYDDRAALRGVQTAGNLEDQGTFQQLEALYAEQERLQQALGVSSADQIIEMVENLNAQLDEFYEERDATVESEEKRNVSSRAPAESSATAPMAESASDETTPRPATSSVEHQLEALYREKEVLFRHGLASAQEAVSQLQAQQKQIDALQRETQTYRQRFERLQSDVGTASVSQLVKLAQAFESEADRSLDEVLDATAEAPTGSGYVDIEATPSFVDDDTLDRLDEMTPGELNALTVGVVQLDDDGTVEYLNEAALQLPGLSSVESAEAVVGRNFFRDLAPSASSNLLYGRFRQGKRRGEMDARFPYTFVGSGGGAQAFAVHLYRRPESTTTWLLYRPS